MEIADMTPNDFLRIIQEESCQIDIIPDGWYSCQDLQKSWNLCATIVQDRIRAGKLLGYVTERKFLINRNGRRMIPHYKFHEKEDRKKKNKRTELEDTIRSRWKN